MVFNYTLYFLYILVYIKYTYFNSSFIKQKFLKKKERKEEGMRGKKKKFFFILFQLYLARSTTSVVLSKYRGSYNTIGIENDTHLVKLQSQRVVN